MLEMVQAAPDPSLLSMDELQAAIAGLAIASTISDRDLARIGLAVSAEIAGWCGVSLTETGEIPTFRKESLRETLWNNCSASYLQLSRRFVSNLVVTEGTTVLVATTDYIVSSTLGKIARWQNAGLYSWAAGQITVEYDAGFEAVPDDLKNIAEEMVRLRIAARSRDPLIRSETTEGADSVTYRDAAPAGSDFMTMIAPRLARYASWMVA